MFLKHKKLLAWRAVLNKGWEAHLLDAMKTLHDVLSEMEVSTILCWRAKSYMLNPFMNADSSLSMQAKPNAQNHKNKRI